MIGTIVATLLIAAVMATVAAGAMAHDGAPIASASAELELSDDGSLLV
jgi:hypothetical protein